MIIAARKAFRLLQNSDEEVSENPEPPDLRIPEYPETQFSGSAAPGTPEFSKNVG